jgi:hypothetical protein
VLNNPLRYSDPSGHWYYDPGCQCLVKTKDPTHENEIDPVSAQGPEGAFFNYDETPATNPIKGFMPQDGGAAYCAATGDCPDIFPGVAPILPDRWGVRIDATFTELGGVDINVEFTCRFGTAIGCRVSGAIGPEVGPSMGAQVAIGPVFVWENPEEKPLTVSTIGGQWVAVTGVEVDVTRGKGFVEIFVGVSFGGGAGVYSDPASIPYNGADVQEFLIDVVQSLLEQAQ